jgi:putative oxidoreductase
MKNKKNILSWIVRVVAAVILLQTLYFKFTGHEDSVFIFTQLGLEPGGRIAIGIIELITAILLILPRTVGIGAVLGLGVISGAIFSHLTKLGIEVKGDGGTLFYLALTVFICCLVAAILHRKEIPVIKKLF